MDKKLANTTKNLLILGGVFCVGYYVGENKYRAAIIRKLDRGITSAFNRTPNEHLLIVEKFLADVLSEGEVV